jgi:hypothetical protein
MRFLGGNGKKKNNGKDNGNRISRFAYELCSGLPTRPRREQKPLRDVGLDAGLKPSSTPNRKAF